jgi:hypothetical protein
MRAISFFFFTLPPFISRTAVFSFCAVIGCKSIFSKKQKQKVHGHQQWCQRGIEVAKSSENQY